MGVSALFANRVLVTAVICWFVAQTLKVLIFFYLEGRFSFERFHGSGGMPSSHASTVCGLAFATGYIEGFSSTIFALAVIFAIIVMHDASNVRRSVGHHARLLNQQFDELIKNGMNQKLFKELIGHEPLEVFVGSILGLCVSAALNIWIF